MLNHLTDVSIRSLLLALVAAAMLWLLRRGRTAALQHAVWSAVVCGMLALFAVGEFLPRMPLPVLASPTPSIPLVPFTAVTTDAPAITEEFAPAPRQSPSKPVHTFDWTGMALFAYAAIALIFLTRFALGAFFARRLSARSSANGSFHESELLSIPVTVGWLRPRIILPLEWREWPREKLTAVLTHEGAHASRHDGLIAALAHVNRCIFWFHPLAWWLERRLALLAEQACDEACVATLGDRDHYARLLLEMASGVNGSQGRLHHHALTMAGTSHIRQRIDSLLVEGRTFSRGLTWAGWAAIFSCGIPIVLGAGALEVGRKPPVLLAQAVPLRAARPTFEAASIRLAPMSAPIGDGSGRGRSGGSGTPNCGPPRMTVDESFIHYTCVPLKRLIEFAYSISERPGLITGPDWMMDTSPGVRFDIEAKLPDGAAKTQVPEMFQSLLADRFKLASHRGTTDQPVNAIVVDKGGLKLKKALANPPEPVPDPAAMPCAPGAQCLSPHVANSHGEQVTTMRMAQQIDKYSSPNIGTALITNSPTGSRLEAPGTTLAGLAILLRSRSLLDVVDMTDLKGRYQIQIATSLDMRTLIGSFTAGQITEEDVAAAESKAWQVALLKVGLRLEQRKAAAETLIVDHAEKMPTAN